MDRVASHPGTSGVRSCSAEGHRHAKGSLTSGLDDRVGGFAEDGDITDEEIGPRLEQLAEATLDRCDLFTGVEDPGDIDGRRGGGARQLQHHRQPALHVGRPDSVQTIPLDPGATVVRGRDRVGVAGEDHPLRAIERRAGDEIVSDAGDLEMRMTAQFGLDEIDQWSLGPTRGRDIDERGGARQQVGRRVGIHDAQVAAP
jgi:hypothetical protein